MVSCCGDAVTTSSLCREAEDLLRGVWRGDRVQHHEGPRVKAIEVCTRAIDLEVGVKHEARVDMPLLVYGFS